MLIQRFMGLVSLYRLGCCQIVINPNATFWRVLGGIRSCAPLFCSWRAHDGSSPQFTMLLLVDKAGSLSHTQDDVGALPIEGSAIFAFLVQGRRGDTHMQTNPFATEAAEYAHLRPTYPDNLFEFLATIVVSRNIAWDCATGNGQAATHLARHFGQVIATDESGEMIAQAPRDPKITYWVAEAEDCDIEDHLVDLVTVASAIHWFDLDRFYAEVRRVVKPGEP